MRADKFLNKVCLIKTRNIAKKASDNGLIFVNGKKAKACKKVCENDIVKFSVYGFETEILIKQIPSGNVSKKNAAENYEIIRREKIIPDDE
ncbi:MAG: RNA-binding protein [Candidatus Cloacimonadota bacterium]|nr:MAG: RNA-binding protein [Candidatus Cloacimonadota bacterium]